MPRPPASLRLVLLTPSLAYTILFLDQAKHSAFHQARHTVSKSTILCMKTSSLTLSKISLLKSHCGTAGCEAF